MSNGEHVEYHLKTDEVLRKIVEPENRGAISHIVFDPKVDDGYDDLLVVSVTHDGTAGNESYVILNMLKPLIANRFAKQFETPVSLRWRLGHILIAEKRGKVIAAGREVDGVAQQITIPVKMELVK